MFASFFSAHSRVARAFRQRTPEQLELCEVSFAGSRLSSVSVHVCPVIPFLSASLRISQYFPLHMHYASSGRRRRVPNNASRETHYFLLLWRVFTTMKKLVVLSFAKQ